ncbi:MAG: exodeoxyribonuclease VII small subunit [candidate division Zixibacteria bacterium]|nr:exodeoxyribonuclease VII small subunit [candidate division Zixibacteria bacterium]MCI0595737.1 exodeoxyribonuclease VII small subunit [candidate division Zixibacteria bacterium]
MKKEKAAAVAPVFKEPKSFEAALARLEEIAARLESGETGLEESLGFYQEGMQLSTWCQKKLDEAQKKLKILVRNKGGEIEVREE